MEDLEKIKARIAKLLRMAQDESSPHEAANAAGRARKLMDKYQIDAMDLGQAEEEFGTEIATPFLKDLPNYLTTLAVAVAKYNDCQARYENSFHSVRTWEIGKAIKFLGYKSDTALATEMFKRLSKAINRLCKEYLDQNGYVEYNAAIGGQFKTGASIAIITRLTAMTRERDALTSSGGTSLVVTKTKSVNNHFGETQYGAVNSRRLSAAEMAARSVGHTRGTAVEINRSVR